MEKLRILFIKLFKLQLYYIEKNSLVGDTVVPLGQPYSYNEEGVIGWDLSEEESVMGVKYKYLYITKSAAQKEIAKNSLQYPEKHVRLIREIESAGIVLSSYARTQILEDGEDSQIYQNLVVKNET